MSGSDKTRKRVLLKLSGEALKAKDNSSVVDTKFAVELAEELKSVIDAGVELAIVLGGGNIFRGKLAEDLGMDRVRGDYMGMLATVINSLAIQSALELIGQPAIVQSPVAMSSTVEPLHQGRARRKLSEGKIVIFGGGTGNPYFTTDSAAALRAIELECDALLKATKVDGVYSADPMKDKSAKKYDTLSYQNVIEKNLRVMDQMAFSLCRETALPITVFSIREKGSIKMAAVGDAIGTVVR